MFKDKIKHEEPWNGFFQQLSHLKKFKKKCFPNFFIISPPKTGSTWLSYNLNCHPEILIPDVKEIKYFSNHWQSEDINWYLKFFRKGIDQQKGDASPSYAILPVQTIRLIKSLMPELKLIFLMRDPIYRAWSHTKHNYKYFEAGFKSYNGSFETITDLKFIENFLHEWSLAFGDYLGCLKRWLSVFSKEQFYVGFYETIENNPKKLLTEIFEHIGVHKKVDWSQTGISEKIFSGIEKEIPDNLYIILKLIYKKRTLQLARFLKKQFDIDIPPEWQNTLDGSDEISSPILIEKDYKGFKIFLYQGKYYATIEDIGHINISVTNLINYQEQGKCIAGKSLFETRHLIQQILSKSHKEGSQSQNQNLISKSLLHEDLNNIFPQEFDDQRLVTILAMDESPTHPLLEEVYRGFNIIYYGGKYYALFQGLGPVDLIHIKEDKLIEYKKNFMIIIARSIIKTKCLILLLILKKYIISLLKKLIA